MILWKYLFTQQKTQKEAGFTIPLVLGFGLFMLAIGIASIRLSSDSEVNSLVQTKTKQAVGAAELGVARFQEILSASDHRVLAVYTDCVGTRVDNDGDSFPEFCPDGIAGDTSISWQNPTAIPGLIRNPLSCTPENVTGALPTEITAPVQWQDIDNSSTIDTSKGQFRLISYTYTPTVIANGATSLPGNALLTLEGRTEQAAAGATIADKAINTSTSQIQVNIPILEDTEFLVGGFPALWASAGNDSSIGTNKVNGNILYSSITCGNVNSGIPVNVSAAQNIVQNGTEFTGELTAFKDTTNLKGNTPDLPANKDLNYIQPDELFGTTGTIPATPPTTLPRPTDIQYQGAYHYLVPSLEMDDGESLLLQADTRIVLYVQGNISFYGQINDTSVTGFSTPQLQIYGNTTASPGRDNSGFKYGCDDVIDANNVSTPNSCPTSLIEFDDSADVDAFIHAPLAWGCLMTGTGGSATTETPLTGALWILEWADGTSGQLVASANGTSGVNISHCTVGNRTIIQSDPILSDDAQNILGAINIPTTGLPQISPISAWEIKESSQ